jgi:hypothetical protein
MLTIALFLYQCFFHNKICDFKSNIQTKGLRAMYTSDASRPTPVCDVKRLLHFLVAVGLFRGFTPFFQTDFGRELIEISCSLCVLLSQDGKRGQWLSVS